MLGRLLAVFYVLLFGSVGVAAFHPIVSRPSCNNPTTTTTSTTTTTILGATTGYVPQPRASSSPPPTPYLVDPYWRSKWWPICVESTTDKAKPYPFTLLSNPIVLWWDGGNWRCVDDCCPHRLVPLSEGRIEGSDISCPYHGWQFRGSDGACTRIPQLEPEDDLNRFSKSCSVAAYPVAVAQGLIFVYGTPLRELEAPPDPSTIPLSEPLKDPETICLDISRDLPYSYETLLENILDPSHVAFTHHKTVGNRAWAGPVPLKVVGPLSEEGFNGTWERMVPVGPMTRRDPSQVKRETTFIAPSYMHHSIEVPEMSTWTVTYAIPMAPGRSRIIARFPFRFRPVEGKSNVGTSLMRQIFPKVPAWIQHIQQNTVLDDDNIFLHQQERRLSARGGKWSNTYVLPTKADIFIATFRKWVDLHGAGGPFGAASMSLDPLSWRTPEDLLDRYDQHVRHCHSCSTALANIRKLKPMVFTAAILALSLSSLVDGSWGWSRIGCLSIGAILGVVWKFMDNTESLMIRGPHPPPRNQEDKKK